MNIVKKGEAILSGIPSADVVNTIATSANKANIQVIGNSGSTVVSPTKQNSQEQNKVISHLKNVYGNNFEIPPDTEIVVSGK